MAEELEMTWAEYCARNRSRCEIQAGTLKKHLLKLQNGDHRSLACHFMFLNDTKGNLQILEGTLSQNYKTELLEQENGKYWTVECSDSPVSIDAIVEKYSLKWVGEMCTLAEKCGCTFSSWTFIDLDTREIWSNSGVPNSPAG